MNTPRAFTLIELVVSIGIISVISAVVFFNFPQFNQTIHLNRSARELTVSLREAQARATAVTPLPNGEFPNNYGVFIEKAPDANGNGQYVLFSDYNNNLKFDPILPIPALPPLPPIACTAPPDGECIKIFTFTNGIQITGLDAGITGLNIFYRRPDPIVVISDQGAACIAGPSSIAGCSGGSYGPFTITISRPQGHDPSQVKKVEVYRTGQISIQ